MDSHQYLLDTNIISHLIRNPSGPVLNHLESVLPATACTSIIVSAEIHFGLQKKASAKLTKTGSTNSIDYGHIAPGLPG